MARASDLFKRIIERGKVKPAKANPNALLNRVLQQGRVGTSGSNLEETQLGNYFKQNVVAPRAQNIRTVATGVKQAFTPGTEGDTVSLRDFGKAAGNLGLDLATLAIPAARIPRAIAKAAPLTRLVGSSAIRGAEGAAAQFARDVLNTGNVKESAKKIPVNIATGAAFNTVLSPRLAGDAIRYPKIARTSQRLQDYRIGQSLLNDLNEKANQAAAGEARMLARKSANAGFGQDIVPVSRRLTDKEFNDEFTKLAREYDRETTKINGLPELRRRELARRLDEEFQAKLNDLESGRVPSNSLPLKSEKKLSIKATADTPSPASTGKPGRLESPQEQLAEKRYTLPTKGQGGGSDRLETYGSSVAPPTVRGNITPPELNFGQWKDKGALSLGRETLERNIERYAGADAPKLKQFVTEPIKVNETARASWLTKTRHEVRDVAQSLGIKAGSKEDALIQRFGEKNISLEDLQREAPKKWQQIAEGAQYFRQKYDDLLDQVNQVRTQFGYDPIPKREDYFRHFQELGDTVDKIGVLFNERDLPTEIAGITNIFKPGKPFTTTELRRLGGKYTESAIKGMDNYLDAVSKQIFHTDSVQRVRSVEKYIREAGAAGEAKLPNVVANLSEYGNLLSGKKAQVDRAIESTLGRRSLGAINWIRQRTSANMIGGNISSALTNFLPFTQSLATTSKTAAAQGILETSLAPLTGKFNDIDGLSSAFLTRRFPEAKIQYTGWDKAGRAANWLFESVDRFVSRAIVAGKYYEGLQKGLDPKVAMKAADDYAGRLVTDRSWGQLPNLLGTKTLGPLTQFQAEVNNQFSFLTRDIPQLAGGNKAKIAGSLAQVALYSYLANNLYEKVIGRRPALDPIYAAETLFGANEEGEGKSTGKRIVAAGKDVAENLPFVGGITGGRLPISAGVPDVTKLVKGEADLSTELSKAGYYILPPFGGGQLKKTVEGVKAFDQGASTTKSGNVRYPIKQDTANAARTALFGQYSVPEAREYFAKERTPLSEKQSQVALASTDIQALYDKTIAAREAEQADTKAKKDLQAGKKNQNAAELGNGLYQLPSGKVTWVKDNGDTQDFDTQPEAEMAMAKDAFKKSNKNFEVRGDVVFRKSKTGEVTTESKVEYDSKLLTNKLQRAKALKDYKSWLELANQQLSLLDQQLQDPTLDELDQSDLIERAENLLEEMDKYTSYGGFTKPKKGRKLQVSVPDTGARIPVRAPKAPKTYSRRSRTVKLATRKPNIKLKQSRGA